MGRVPKTVEPKRRIPKPVFLDHVEARWINARICAHCTYSEFPPIEQRPVKKPGRLHVIVMGRCTLQKDYTHAVQPTAGCRFFRQRANAKEITNAETLPLAPGPVAECGFARRVDGECSVHVEDWMCLRARKES